MVTTPGFGPGNRSSSLLVSTYGSSSLMVECFTVDEEVRVRIPEFTQIGSVVQLDRMSDFGSEG